MDGQVLDFGTSGNLRHSNLIMYDRQTHSWWQEMGGQAIVGDLTGQKLEQLYLGIVSWGEYKASFPAGKVLSRDTGYSRPYGSNPYSGYDQRDPFLFDGPADRRLGLMERVVGVTIGNESIAVPFAALREEKVVPYTLSGQDLVVFFKEGTASAIDASYIPNSRDVGATGVFDPNLEGRKLTFESHPPPGESRPSPRAADAAGDGPQITDVQTGSTWDLLGRATSGPLEGKQLSAIPHSGSQLWFSWAVFQPDTEVYGK